MSDVIYFGINKNNWIKLGIILSTLSIISLIIVILYQQYQPNQPPPNQPPPNQPPPIQPNQPSTVPPISQEEKTKQSTPSPVVSPPTVVVVSTGINMWMFVGIIIVIFILILVIGLNIFRGSSTKQEMINKSANVPKTVIGKRNKNQIEKLEEDSKTLEETSTEQSPNSQSQKNGEKLEEDSKTLEETLTEQPLNSQSQKNGLFNLFNSFNSFDYKKVSAVLALLLLASTFKIVYANSNIPIANNASIFMDSNTNLRDKKGNLLKIDDSSKVLKNYLDPSIVHKLTNPDIKRIPLTLDKENLSNSGIEIKKIISPSVSSEIKNISKSTNLISKPKLFKNVLERVLIDNVDNDVQRLLTVDMPKQIAKTPLEKTSQQTTKNQIQQERMLNQRLLTFDMPKQKVAEEMLTPEKTSQQTTKIPKLNQTQQERMMNNIMKKLQESQFINEKGQMLLTYPTYPTEKAKPSSIKGTKNIMKPDDFQRIEIDIGKNVEQLLANAIQRGVLVNDKGQELLPNQVLKMDQNANLFVNKGEPIRIVPKSIMNEQDIFLKQSLIQLLNGQRLIKKLEKDRIVQENLKLNNNKISKKMTDMVKSGQVSLWDMYNQPIQSKRVNIGIDVENGYLIDANSKELIQPIPNIAGGNLFNGGIKSIGPLVPVGTVGTYQNYTGRGMIGV